MSAGYEDFEGLELSMGMGGLAMQEAARANIASAIRELGTANAATPMGAVELLAMEVKEGTERIADALHRIADKMD